MASKTFYIEQVPEAIEMIANKFNEINTAPPPAPPPAPVIRYASDPPHEVEDFTLIPQ
jgi:hypothetical protein